MSFSPPPEESITFLPDRQALYIPKEVPFITPANQLENSAFQSTKQLAGPNPEELHYKLTQAQNMMQSSSKKVLGTMSDSKDGRRQIEKRIISQLNSKPCSNHTSMVNLSDYPRTEIAAF